MKLLSEEEKEKLKYSFSKNVSAFIALIGLFSTLPFFVGNSEYYFTFPIGIFFTAFIFSPLLKKTPLQNLKLGPTKKIAICFAVYGLLSLFSRSFYQQKTAMKLENRLANERTEVARLEKLTPLERAKEVFGKMVISEFTRCRNPKYPNFDITWEEIRGQYLVKVYFVIKNGNISGIDTSNLMVALHKISSLVIASPTLAIINQIEFSPRVEGLNRLGNETFEQAAKITLVPDDLKKMNWNNMDVNLFYKYLKASNLIWINEKHE